MKLIFRRTISHRFLPVTIFATILVFALLAGYSMKAGAQSDPAVDDASSVKIHPGPGGQAVKMMRSVRDLPDAPPATHIEPEFIDPVFVKPPLTNPYLGSDAPVAPNMPAATLNFDSIKLNDACGGSYCGGGYPPDTVGDVGPSHYIAAVNTAIAIFDKTGNRLALYSYNQLWNSAGTGTDCDANNQGDPTVVYDPIGDRWIVADFAFTSPTVPPFYECIAVSMTNDPVNGGWYLYAVRADDASYPYFPDYPKMGIWTDALYMTANMFNSSLSFAEVRVWAFNRMQLEAGTLTSQIVDLNSTQRFSLLPANLRGTRPPAGRDEFLAAESEVAWAFEVYTFHTDWVTPANTTFTGPVNVTQDSYIVPGTDIRQPNTAHRLDSLGERLMMQTQYTNIDGVESLWVAHTIRPSNSSPEGIQWAQIDVTDGSVNTTAVQQQQFTNGSDTLYRWMPSIAADNRGDVVVGYSASNSSTYPEIRYAGRLVTDTSSTLGQGEATLPLSGLGNMDFNCGGSACTRWGDYTAMSVDPVDNCTFWYVNEYYPTPDGSTFWHTRINTVSFPSCVPYISYNTTGPDRYNNPGYSFDVALAHLDASQQVCMRWSDDSGASWIDTATCTYNAGTGKWTCDIPTDIPSSSITYQFWIGASTDSCAVTGNETLWTGYSNFSTAPTNIGIQSFTTSQPGNGWLYPILALGVLGLFGLFWLLRRRQA